MFELIFLLDIAEGCPGMLVPLFSSKKTNMPYVQQMDEYLIVKDVIPFLEYENYAIVPSDAPRSVSLGDKGIIAFRSVDNAIICGDFEEVLTYIGAHLDLVSNDPVLRMQLHRVESAELKPSYENWRKVAAQVFDDVDQGKFWIDSELQLFQKQKRIWRDIDRLDADESKGDDSEAYDSLRTKSTEYLIRWLSQRSNFTSRNWTRLWHYVHERLPFDDRVAQIGVNWMYALHAESEDFSQTKTVMYALLQGWLTLGKDYPDYGEFLSDRLATEPSFLFSLLRPKKLFELLFDYLVARGNLDDVLKLLRFSISDLPNEPYITETIENALDVIANSYHDEPTPPNFDHRHLEQARKLAEILRAAR
jgi:hypothetical protein